MRLTTLDKFETSGWTQGQLTARPEDRVSNGIGSGDDIAPGVPTSSQRTSIEIRSLSKSPFLPIYANPTKVDVDGDWRWDDGADTVFSSRSSTGSLRYSFESVRVEYDRDRLAAAPPLDPSDAVVNEFTGTNGKVDDVAKAVLVDLEVDKKTTQYEKVMTINDYFSPENGFKYSLETVSGTTGTDLGDFLNNKQGYCQQYASATAYLIRAAGIPARVAIGFDRGIQKDGYVSVTNKNAHAWVEVYFNGLGWVPFDTTPPGGDGRSAGLLPWARDASDGVNTPIPGVPTAPSATATPGVTNPDDLADDPDKGLSIDSGPSTPKPIDVPLAVAPLGGLASGLIDGGHWPDLPLWAGILLVLALVLLIAAIPALVRIQTRRHRMAVARSPNALVAAHSAWDELMDMLADLGMPADDSETPRSTARRLAATGLDQAERHAVELLAADEERARYAPPGALAPAATVAKKAGRATGRAAVGTASVNSAGAGVLALARRLPGATRWPTPAHRVGSRRRLPVATAVREQRGAARRGDPADPRGAGGLACAVGSCHPRSPAPGAAAPAVAGGAHQRRGRPFRRGNVRDAAGMGRDRSPPPPPGQPPDPSLTPATFTRLWATSSRLWPRRCRPKHRGLRRAGVEARGRRPGSAPRRRGPGRRGGGPLHGFGRHFRCYSTENVAQSGGCGVGARRQPGCGHGKNGGRRAYPPAGVPLGQRSLPSARRRQRSSSRSSSETREARLRGLPSLPTTRSGSVRPARRYECTPSTAAPNITTKPRMPSTGIPAGAKFVTRPKTISPTPTSNSRTAKTTRRSA